MTAAAADKSHEQDERTEECEGRTHRSHPQVQPPFRGTAGDPGTYGLMITCRAGRGGVKEGVPAPIPNP